MLYTHSCGFPFCGGFCLLLNLAHFWMLTHSSPFWTGIVSGWRFSNTVCPEPHYFFLVHSRLHKVACPGPLCGPLLYLKESEIVTQRCPGTPFTKPESALQTNAECGRRLSKACLWLLDPRQLWPLQRAEAANGPDNKYGRLCGAIHSAPTQLCPKGQKQPESGQKTAGEAVSQ